MPAISVLINSYNYGQYIADAIESVLKQSRRPEQIIVVDDGSTDGTSQIVTERYRDRPEVTLVTQSNRGQLAAIVAGFQQAQGDVIFLLDADDRYQADHIAKVMATYETRRDVDFVFTGMMEFGASANPRLYAAKDHYFSSSVIRSLLVTEWVGEATSALSCRRWVLDALLPVFVDLAPQWKIRADDCVIRGSSAVGARKLFLAQTTVDYRVHGTNSFATQKLELAQHRQHWTRTRCFIHRVNDHVGLRDQMVDAAHLEFEQLPQPNSADLASYSALVKRSGYLSFFQKLRMLRHIRRHYARHGARA